MTCRGSRRNTVDKAKNIYEDSPEWLAQNQRSTRNFIRKWGHFVKHDSLMKPIIPHKYDIGFIIKDCPLEILEALEPWCSTFYTDSDIEKYISLEQPNTVIDLRERFKPYDNEKQNQILVEINNNLTQEDFNNITRLSEIITLSGEEGEFELGNLNIYIHALDTFEKDLIKL